MTAARWPRHEPQRLLHVAADTWRDHAFDALPALLGPGDLLVVNDAATLPASLRGPGVELRLLGLRAGRWHGVLFGAGDWRTDTDMRPPPPPWERFDVGGLGVRIVARDPVSPRLVEVRFDRAGAALWEALYARGRPVQYSYLDDELPLRAVQTPYAVRPWAAEMPSAGRPLTVDRLAQLRDRGVGIAWLTHAAGLSSTGDPVLDARLPLPEAYEIPAATVQAIRKARRVVAVGTSVVRALEGHVASHGRLVGGPGITDLVIGPGFVPRVVDGLLSGMHEPGESHFRVHQAFAGEAVLRASHRHAVVAGYHNHEFGDSTLVLSG